MASNLTICGCISYL